MELDVVNTPAFQRLHHIRQLGPAFLVYPTAQHTRFSHCVGALYVVSEFIDAMTASSPDSPQFSDDKSIQELRLAALLHDIGHHPFSHVFEEKITNLDGDEAKHTMFAEHIINHSSIKDEIDDYDRRSIISMIQGTHTERAYNSLISSTLDADRLDYLKRDSYFTGVAYGSIDIPRIMRVVRLVHDDIVYEIKGLPTIENYLMALMSMYWAVYYHKTIASFSLILGRIYELFRERDILPSLADLKHSVESELYDYNDVKLLNLIAAYQNDGDDLGTLCGFFLHRKPLRMVDYERVYGFDTNPQTRITPLWFSGSLDSVARDAGISTTDIFLMKFDRSFMDTNDLIHVYSPSNESVTAVTELRHSAICDLVGKSYFENRVYTYPNYADSLERAIHRHFGSPSIS